MRRSVSGAAFALALACAAPAAAKPQAYAGVQGMLLTGTHTDIAGSQRGVALGAIIEAGARLKRLSLRLEGIPPVSLPQKPSDFYGQATPQLSLIDGALRYALDGGSRYSLGLGETVINQRTPLPNISQVVTSRLGGLRIEAAYRSSYSASHFWEVMAGAAPHLTGSDHYAYSIDHPPVDKPEVAAEEDASIAWGLQSRGSEFLIGIRTIDFSAKYVQTGESGDRNNGGGIIVEWRHLFE